MNLKRTRTCGELRAADEGAEVILNGWVDSARDHGGVYFVDMRDRYGITQVQCDPEKFPGAGDLRSETVVAVRGTVRLRPEGMANKDRDTGDIEVWAEELEVLSPTEVIPFEIVDEAEAKEDTRLRHRYLDIRRRPVTEALVLRSRVAQVIREVFHGEDFLEVETPLLMKTTPEGARDFVVPSRLQPGKVYALPQSPQLLKQTMMVAGLDRYFQLCKCLRDEDLRADRQPEFTQLDMEMSFVDSDDVFAVVEKTIARLYKDLKGVDVSTPFRRMSYAEAMERFGIDKPDTRFGLELCDVSEVAAECGFKVFSGAVANGGSVRAIAVPGGAAMARKKVDKLEKVAKEYGAKGLAWLKLTDEGVQGPVAKFLTEDEVARLCEKTGAEKGSLLVFVADQDSVTYAALAHVRLALGNALELIDHSQLDVLWVMDFPLFEYDEDFGGWMAMHHMFTMPKSDLPEGDDVDLAGILGNQYDLVMNGNEMGSGSIRIHRPEIQRRVFELIGMSEEETEAKFGWFLRALQFGAPPHGGIALGLDRLVMVMLGYDNIRDVIAFPKNASGVDPMTDSPSEPEADAFEVLGLELKPQPEKVEEGD